HLDALRHRRAAAEKKYRGIEGRLESAQTSWEKTALSALPGIPADQLVVHYEFEHHTADTSGSNLNATTRGKVQYAPGVVGSALKLDGTANVEVPYGFDLERTDAF